MSAPITRRSVLKTVGAAAGLTATSVAAAADTETMTAQECIDHHLAEICKAWTEIYGEPRVVEISPNHRWLLIAN